MSAHIGDDAELYALGVLEPGERDAIDAHLEGCAECSHRARAAERLVAALDALGEQDWPAVRRFDRIRATALAAVAAGVLAVGLGGALAVEDNRTATILASDGTVISALAHAHFEHAPFVAGVSRAPSAKVLYARNRAWVYVIVAAAHDDWRVAAKTSGTEVILGRLQTRGATSVLFARAPQALAALSLIDAQGVAVERVDLPPSAHP